MSKNSSSLGVVIVIVGLAILLGKIGVFGFLGALFWPVFLLIPGLLLHYFYFSRFLPSTVLVPGGILSTYSLMFFFCNLPFVGWDTMAYLWPGFILGVAIGLYEFYFFDAAHPKAILYSALILAIVAAAFFVMALLFSVGIYLIAIALILFGGFMIMGRTKGFKR